MDINGGDMSEEEGGGGVDVEKGDLDGCAYIYEENIRCGCFTYDKESNRAICPRVLQERYRD